MSKLSKWAWQDCSTMISEILLHILSFCYVVSLNRNFYDYSTKLFPRKYCATATIEHSKCVYFQVTTETLFNLPSLLPDPTGNLEGRPIFEQLRTCFLIHGHQWRCAHWSICSFRLFAAFCRTLRIERELIFGKQSQSTMCKSRLYARRNQMSAFYMK